ncbi:hypothetical protein Tco_1340405 [Tanacetum coccineum]
MGLRSYRNNCRRNGWNACGLCRFGYRLGSRKQVTSKHNGKWSIGAVKDEDDSGSWGFNTVAPTPLPPSQSPARPQPARKLGPLTPCDGRGLEVAASLTDLLEVQNTVQKEGVGPLDLVELEAELQD